ncbi:hypothetical protein JCM15765_33800 [Paradesulfitobacterium aromaticivorans]
MNTNLALMDSKTNLFGQRLNPNEERIWQTYLELKELAAQTDLPPFALNNVRSALALMWQVVNGLNIEYEELDEVGV